MSRLPQLTSALFAALLSVLPVTVQAQSCAVGPEVIPNGVTERFYMVPSVPRGGSCAAQAVDRTCRAGALTGQKQARYGGCTVLEGFTGINTNRRPDDLDPALLAQTGTHWVRSNVDILTYRDNEAAGKRDPRWDFNDWNLWKAAAAGPQKKAILNLMWDFEPRNRRIPLPGSAEEQALFAYLDARILTPLAPHADIITSGNEPFINSLKKDWKYDARAGGIPIVLFYQRVTEHVDAWLRAKGLRDNVDLYVGSFTRLHTKNMQQLPAVKQLLAYAEEAPFVDGIDMHTHVMGLGQIEKALKFARRATAKPIIVTEYTMVHAMRQAMESGEKLGQPFAGRWGLDPRMTINDYMACRVYKRRDGCGSYPPVTKAEWDDFFATRSWYIDHFLLRADEIFRRNGVHGATYGLSAGAPNRRMLQPDSIPWYLGMLFAEGALGDAPNGLPYPNYQVLDDFRRLQR